MSKYIAIVTASGKAYYRLASECKQKRIPFLSFVPGESIPFKVKVAITTKPERDRVYCPRVLIYDEWANPSTVVNQAFQMLQGKTRYHELVVGVDPGKIVGMAVLGDGIVLRTDQFPEAEKVVMQIVETFSNAKADRQIVKIGNGAGAYHLRLIDLLDQELPNEIEIECVEESGTTKSIIKPFFQGMNSTDALSAIKISMRTGFQVTRKKRTESHSFRYRNHQL